MRSVTDVRRLAGGLVLVLVAAAPLSARQEPPASARFSEQEITAAVAAVRRDPNLGGETTMKMLRWRENRQRTPMDMGWLSWIAGFFRLITQSSRYLVWAAAAVLAAWLGVYLTRAFRNRLAAPAEEPFVPPTHVRDLDIRPQSLPANIGRAARGLWDRGDHRAALSLLYRGLLSRLTHVHRVPISDASTEGDCLSLLTGRVPAATGEYSARLVGAWQGFVYGGAATPAGTMHALCDEFAGALDRRAAMPAGDGAE